MAPEELNETMKGAGDMLSMGVVLGALTQFLPPIAAILTIVWTCIRIYEWMRVRLFNKQPITSLDLKMKEN